MQLFQNMNPTLKVPDLLGTDCPASIYLLRGFSMKLQLVLPITK